jgi:hypothetical protein
MEKRKNSGKRLSRSGWSDEQTFVSFNEFWKGLLLNRGRLPTSFREEGLQLRMKQRKDIRHTLPTPAE